MFYVSERKDSCQLVQQAIKFVPTEISHLMEQLLLRILHRKRVESMTNQKATSFRSGSSVQLLLRMNIKMIAAKLSVRPCTIKRMFLLLLCFARQ